jgi:hypothetical protein
MPPPPPTSKWYLLVAGLLVALGTALVAEAISHSPIPPGVDPGHWLSISYSYVGLPTAPDPTDKALFYPPLLFPMLGALVLAFGPLTAAALTAIGLFAAYGATAIHLARRYLFAGPLQVALVGLAVFSGPTLQMVFWGGYPNLLGFVLMNEAFVFLLLYLRYRRPLYGYALFALVGLTYFAHDLSFLVLLGGLAASVVFLLLLGKIRFRFLWERANVIGMAVLVGVIVGYIELTARLGISHPNYLSANPSAYVIDELGELFVPLAHNPIFPPEGPALILPSLALAWVLAAAPLVGLLVLAIARNRVPKFVDARVVIAVAWFSVALAVPGVGYLAHVPTDYSRFLYFLPLPFFLLALLTVEHLTRPWWPVASPARRGRALGRTSGTIPPGIARRAPTSRGVLATMGVVGVLLTVLFATVAVPVALDNEAAAAASAHDSDFLAAMAWLKEQPGAGSVLTVAPASRWTEALSDRESFTVGPEWLLFDPFQIADTQESYWALTSQYAVSNDRVVLAFSGFSSQVFSQAPMYTPFVQGVEFPVLRVLPGSLSVVGAGPAGTGQFPLDGGHTPVLTLGPLGSSSITAVYVSPVAQLAEVATALPNGSAQLQFTITPVPKETIRSFDLELAPPPGDSTLLSSDVPVNIALSGGTLDWSVQGKLGQYPTRVTVNSQVQFDPAPASARTPALTPPDTWNLSFVDPNGAGPFSVGAELSTQGSSNPAAHLPLQFSTGTFLRNNSIGFLLWPGGPRASAELTYFGATFGFVTAYENPQWIVLERS